MFQYFIQASQNGGSYSLDTAWLADLVLDVAGILENNIEGLEDVSAVLRVFGGQIESVEDAIDALLNLFTLGGIDVLADRYVGKKI